MLNRPLKSIEDFIATEVLPVYANTHSGTSYCSRQTTDYREEARYEVYIASSYDQLLHIEISLNML